MISYETHLCVQMWCVAVVFAVLQLCSPALQADPLLYISQLQDGQERPSESHPNSWI